jgi:hypothetical protein
MLGLEGVELVAGEVGQLLRPAQQHDRVRLELRRLSHLGACRSRSSAFNPTRFASPAADAC